jgi:hypothetical protein
MSNAAGIPGKSGTGQGKPFGTTTKNAPKLMMASDTRPLSSDLVHKVEDRDRRGSSTSQDEDRALPRGRMMASGTPRNQTSCKESASSSDCERTKFELRERIGEHRGEIFKHASEMMQKRFDAALERFEKLADRIDSRIAKMRSAGADTGEAEARMITVRKRLVDARAAVDAVDLAVDSVASSLENGSSTTAESDRKKPAKDAMEKARASLLAVMQALNDVIPALRGTNAPRNSQDSTTTLEASGTPRFPGGMLRTKDRPSTTSSDGRPDPTL